MKSHLTTSSEPAIRICGEERILHLPVKRPEDRPWLREQRTDQYQLRGFGLHKELNMLKYFVPFSLYQ